MEVQFFNWRTEPDITMEIAEWWSSHSMPFDAEALSESGVLVSDKGKNVAASWIYLSNSKLCHIGFTCTNPEAPLIKRGKAINLAIGFLIQRAKELGYTRIMHLSANKGLCRTLEKFSLVRLIPHEFYWGKI